MTTTPKNRWSDTTITTVGKYLVVAIVGALFAYFIQGVTAQAYATKDYVDAKIEKVLMVIESSNDKVMGGVTEVSKTAAENTAAIKELTGYLKGRESGKK